MVAKKRKAASVHYYIKEHMVSLGISDEELAERIGVSSRTQVWKLYSEQSRLDPRKVSQIADALGMHPSELLYPPGTPSLDAIAANATVEQREMAADVLRRMLGDTQQ